MMKVTSTEERKKAIKATRATAELEVGNADCSEDCDNIQNCRGGHRMMKVTSTEERKKAIKATRATAEPEVDSADCPEDLMTATQPEENRGIKGWRKQSTDDWGAKNKNDETMTTKVKESNKCR